MEHPMFAIESRAAPLKLAAAAFFLSITPALAFANHQASDLTPTQRSALQRHVAACDKLSGHTHGQSAQACVDRARSDFERMNRSLSPAQKAALERDSARYQRAIETCNKRPPSERGTCKSEAGMDRTLARST
jgi:hypothetical protein